MYITAHIDNKLLNQYRHVMLDETLIHNMMMIIALTHWNIYFHTKHQLQNIFFPTQMVWSLYKHQGFFEQLKLLNKQAIKFSSQLEWASSEGGGDIRGRPNKPSPHVSEARNTPFHLFLPLNPLLLSSMRLRNNPHHRFDSFSAFLKLFIRLRFNKDRKSPTSLIMFF